MHLPNIAVVRWLTMGDIGAVPLRGGMPQRLRIFISSPADVPDERLRADLIIDKLSQDYSRFFTIEPYRWEHEAMIASKHFQDAIEPPSAFDIVVLILWSRLGTPLPEKTAKSEYRGSVVLPFTNLSGDPNQDYFADGVTENLTTELSRIRDSFARDCGACRCRSDIAAACVDRAKAPRHGRAPPGHGDVLGPGRLDGALRENGPGGFARGYFDLSEMRRRNRPRV